MGLDVDLSDYIWDWQSQINWNRNQDVKGNSTTLVIKLRRSLPWKVPSKTEHERCKQTGEIKRFNQSLTRSKLALFFINFTSIKILPPIIVDCKSVCVFLMITVCTNVSNSKPWNYKKNGINTTTKKCVCLRIGHTSRLCKCKSRCQWPPYNVSHVLWWFRNALTLSPGGSHLGHFERFSNQIHSPNSANQNQVLIWSSEKMSNPSG